MLQAALCEKAPRVPIERPCPGRSASGSITSICCHQACLAAQLPAERGAGRDNSTTSLCPQTGGWYFLVSNFLLFIKGAIAEHSSADFVFYLALIQSA